MTQHQYAHGCRAQACVLEPVPKRQQQRRPLPLAAAACLPACWPAVKQLCAVPGLQRAFASFIHSLEAQKTPSFIHWKLRHPASFIHSSEAQTPSRARCSAASHQLLLLAAAARQQQQHRAPCPVPCPSPPPRPTPHNPHYPQAAVKELFAASDSVATEALEEAPTEVRACVRAMRVGTRVPWETPPHYTLQP